LPNTGKAGPLFAVTLLYLPTTPIHTPCRGVPLWSPTSERTLVVARFC